jgi:hypothetical protein
MILYIGVKGHNLERNVMLCVCMYGNGVRHSPLQSLPGVNRDAVSDAEDKV